MSNTFKVHALAAAVVAVPAGWELVSATQRSTKEKKVADCDKFRGVFIPELSVDEAGVPRKFQGLVLGALRATASDQLAALWKDSTDGLQTVPADCWGVDSLLAFAERVAQSQRLTKEAIIGWYKGSKVAAKLAPKGAKMVAHYESIFGGLAASGLGQNEQQCSQLLAILAGESACWQVDAMVRKLERRISDIQAEAAMFVDLADLVDATEDEDAPL